MSKPKNENRYPGVDTQPWKIVEIATGKSPLTNKDGAPETFAGFGAANSAAVRFTQETGSYASAVRV